ncbi:MAG TPA: prepilin peptidase [Candidatus Dorea gallistercoris]|uniref:Prepilin peptidase n=1 Tax=Candidatus Dorea gallistercoris TaxID=2838542 RepID=A0A9D1UDS4_9FIRM|nr:prepilin peptidase [Candidatus Dorea gallistercoris]
MWEVGRVMCLGVLAGLAVTDICWRRIPAEIFVMGTIGILVYQACSRETDPILLLGGAGVGLIFFVIGKATSQGIGYGDCWGILVLGLYLGLWKLLEVLAGAFLLLLGAVMVLLVKRRMRSKCTLPFFPFLTGGYLMGMMMGGTLW